MKPFRFGVVAAQARTAAEWRNTAARLEATGFSSMLLPDTHGPILAPFSALATAAAVTTTLHVGNWVLANDFRNPVLVAREAATLAFLSEGRFELGFGAGRHDLDYASMGLGEVPSGGVRLSRLAESLEIIRRLLAGETLTFQGEHYSLT
ncbi:MAG TPA: LLM class flavin-dependent oxidoreductase, partial [Chloroflexota bacterium]